MLLRVERFGVKLELCNVSLFALPLSQLRIDQSADLLRQAAIDF